jgi:hypothetical protein
MTKVTLDKLSQRSEMSSEDRKFFRHRPDDYISAPVLPLAAIALSIEKRRSHFNADIESLLEDHEETLNRCHIDIYTRYVLGWTLHICQLSYIAPETGQLDGEHLFPPPAYLRLRKPSGLEIGSLDD